MLIADDTPPDARAGLFGLGTYRYVCVTPTFTCTAVCGLSGHLLRRGWSCDEGGAQACAPPPSRYVERVVTPCARASGVPPGVRPGAHPFRAGRGRWRAFRMGNVLGTVPALPTALSQDAVDALRERTPFDEREVRPISEMMGSGGLQTPLTLSACCVPPRHYTLPVVRPSASPGSPEHWWKRDAEGACRRARLAPHRAAGGSLYAMITYTAAATLPPTWVCWGHWRRLTSEAVCSGSAHG